MTPARPRVYPRIDTDSHILGGEPKVRGTRLSVRTIVVAHQGWGDVNRVVEAYPQFTRRDVEEALVYYEAHKPEIDSFIERDRAED